MPAAKRLKRNKLTLDVAPITDNSQREPSTSRRLTSIGAASASAFVLGRRLSGWKNSGARHPLHRHLDDHRPPEAEGLADQPAHFGGLLGPHAVNAEGLRELHEIGILEGRAVLATPVLVEVAGDIAKGLVVEDNGDDIDAVLGGGGQLLRVVEEAAVTDGGDHGLIGARHLRSEGHRILVAEIARIR